MDVGQSNDGDPSPIVSETDNQLLDRLHPAVAAWWQETYSSKGPVDQGLFTPPQRQTIPLVHEGENVLVSAPTGSGKCILPETPLLVENGGKMTILRASEIEHYAEASMAAIEPGGELFSTSLAAVTIDSEAARTQASFGYTEYYEGEIVTIQTTEGRQVSVTPDHPLLIETADGPEWKPAADITETDNIAYLSKLSLPESVDRFTHQRIIDSLQSRFQSVTIDAESTHKWDGWVTSEDGETVRFAIPESITPKVASFAASVFSHSNRPSETIAGDENRDILSGFELIEEFTSNSQPPASESPPSPSHEVAFAILQCIVGADDCNTTSCPFPDWILNCPRSCKARFLSTYFDRNASETDEYLRISEPNTIRTEQLRHLLLDCDVTPEVALSNELSEISIDQSDLHAIEEKWSNRTSQETVSLPDGGITNHQHGQDASLAWSSVSSIDQKQYAGPVYDLSVPNTHNFIGGFGGLLLHNTLATFTSIINDLFTRAETGDDGLNDSVYCIYISPMKSLANDIHRNLEIPLRAISDRCEHTVGDPAIRHATRHGDTDDAARSAMLANPPHILNTTPETLAILLNAPKFREKLRTVEYIIVDEIHNLAANKRGTHLAVSLERLEQLTTSSPIRIGCSATIEPIDEIGRFLAGLDEDGRPRQMAVVDCRFSREYDIQLVTPDQDLVSTPTDVLRESMYAELHRQIRSHQTTIVFTNSRSGAERVLHQLRERYPRYTTENSACHHGSLSKSTRSQVEALLKDGDLTVVTTSTSLELGVDMSHVDLVIQLGSPKSVASLLQRFGRAGHQIGDTIEGRIIVLDRDELIECAVMVDRAESGFVDSVNIPQNPRDVAVQHIYGMAIAAVRKEAEIKNILTSSYPFRTLSEALWEQIMRYMTGTDDGLIDRGVYPKIWRDKNDPPEGEHHHPEFSIDEALIGKRGRMARVIYFTNIGTIPSSFSCSVRLRESEEWVGSLDEEYLDSLSPGDVFLLGGQCFTFRYRRGGQVYVDPTSDRPTVPTWFSERLPLSLDLGREILTEQETLADLASNTNTTALADYLASYPIDQSAADAIEQMVIEQVDYCGPNSISTTDRIVIEEERDQDAYERRYYIHSPLGRQFNDGCSRLLAHQCAQALDATVKIAVTDRGFSLAMPLNRKIDISGLMADIDTDSIERSLRAAITDTEMFKRYFRMNAARSLMILPRYRGYEKTAREQQMSSEMLLNYVEDLDEFAVYEETVRELLWDKLAIDAIIDFFSKVQSESIQIELTRVTSPSPFAFGLATLSSSEVYLTGDDSAKVEEYQEAVTDSIGPSDSVTSQDAGRNSE